jgi:hypothetical protein
MQYGLLKNKNFAVKRDLPPAEASFFAFFGLSKPY